MLPVEQCSIYPEACSYNSILFQKQRRFSDHIERMTQFKEEESQFTGIFRRKRVRKESRFDTSLNK